KNGSDHRFRFLRRPLVGLAVSGDTITVKEAGLVLVIGVILWIYGIILTKVSNS
ncbi:hypothetical protein R7R25_24985, partial [Vibrio sp. 2026]|nr:hypothetical protein [Vibrio sp. 2026]